MNPSTSSKLLCSALLSLFLAACGGGSDATSGAVGGTVTGLSAGQSVTLQNNGGDNLTISSNTTFAFPTLLALLAPYNVSVLTQPLGQTCTVAGPTGVIPTDGSTANTAVVTCALSSSVGGTVSGLAPGSSVTLSNGSTQVALPGNGPYAFPGLLPAGTPFTVSVVTQPIGQSCTVVKPNGVAANGIEAMVTVSCT